MIAAWAWAALAVDPVVPAMSAQTWRPPLDAERTLWTDDAGVTDGAATAGLALAWTYEPIVWTAADGERVEVLRDAVQADVLAAWTFRRVRAGVDVPVHLLSTGEAVAGGAGLGAVAADVKGVVLDPSRAPVGLAVSGRLALPTATVDAPLAAPGVVWSVGGIADVRLGAWLLAANVGTIGAPRAELGNVTLDDALYARLGAGWAASDAAGVSLDVAGQASYASPLAGAAAAPVEAIAGGWVRVASAWVARGGLGRGLSPGVGAPAARVVLGLTYRPTRAAPVAAAPVATAPASAPTAPVAAEHGTLRIVVTDMDGRPLAAATWALGDGPARPAPGGVATAEVAPGLWQLVVAAPGFVPAEFPLPIEAGGTSEFQVQLRPSGATPAGEGP